MKKTYIMGRDGIIGEFSDFVDFSNLPTKIQKRSWVPNWLWRFVSETVFDIPVESSSYSFSIGTYIKHHV